MGIEEVPFADLLLSIVDNRGRSCPTAATGIPLIATNCVRDDLLFPTYEGARFVSSGTYVTWFRGHPAPGDILFVNKATPGRVCLVPDPVDFCIAQDMVALRVDPKRVYPKYLFAALRSRVVHDRIATLHVGTLIPHFKKADFGKLLIPLPGRRAQEYIGDLYYELSAKIDCNRRMTETLEAVARAIFKAWFVDFESPVAELRDSWPDGTLADVADLNPEAWPSRGRPALLHYVDLAGTKWGKIDSVTAYETTDAPSRAQRILRPGDTIVGTVRPGNGSYALVARDGLTGSTGFAQLRPKHPRDAAFVYLAATARQNIEALAHVADGGAYPAVRPTVVAATPIVVPDQQTLEAFSAAATPLLNRAASAADESATLAAARDGLLPRLLSGDLAPAATISSGLAVS